MMRDNEPMTTLDESEWRQYKRATRHVKYAHRLAQVAEVKPDAWLRAVERDDATDPYEPAIAERQAA
jgi:hypothetical protein